MNLIKCGKVISAAGLIATIACLGMGANAAAQDAPVPGVVRMQNRLILKGLCSAEESLSPDGTSQRLALRLIDQDFRQIYVSRHRSEPIAADPSAVPDLTFNIPRRRTGRQRMPDVIGAPLVSGFDDKGEAVVRLRMPGGAEEEIRVAISSINERSAEVIGLTHNWKYRMATSAIPESAMAPGFLARATEFSDGGTRLNMAGMLANAGHFQAAGRLATSVRDEFPELQPVAEAALGTLREQTADRILAELTLQRDVGQHAQAAAYARLLPDENLVPAVRVAANQLIEDYEELQRRVTGATALLDQAVSEIEDPARRQLATEMVRTVTSELDTHSVDRLTSWELLATDDSMTPEMRIAFAVSGWLLGEDNAFDGFTECDGLVQTRLLIDEFVRTADHESAERATILEAIRSTEGFSSQRVAQMLRLLRPSQPLSLSANPDGSSSFVCGDSSTLFCIGSVPPGYSDTRAWPLLIAVPRQGVSAQDTFTWWQRQANRHGYILVVVEALKDSDAPFDFSAAAHRRLLAVVRQLRLGLRVDDNRVVIAGHGIGGDIAMDVASSHPDVFAGVVSLAGLGRRHLLWSARNSSALGWYVVVGGRQNLMHSQMGNLLIKLFKRSRETHEYNDALFCRYPGRGFESFHEELPMMFDWLQTCRRTSHPEQINANAMRTSDASWYWLEFKSIPQPHQGLEEPIAHDAAPSGHASITAKTTGNNLIVIGRMPDDGFLKLSPDLPNIDVTQPVLIRAAGKSSRVDFEPSVRDLLEEFRRTGDHVRLCHMSVLVQK